MKYKKNNLTLCVLFIKWFVLQQQTFIFNKHKANGISTVSDEEYSCQFSWRHFSYTKPARHQIRPSYMKKVENFVIKWEVVRRAY
jgi:hypothetical protein